MGRGPKPPKGRAKPNGFRKSPNEDSKVHELEERLEEALRDKAEAQEQQAATAEILRVISQSHTEVQPVFDAIAESTMRLFDAWSVGVYRFDGELVNVAAVRGGLPDSEAYLRQRYPMRPLPTTGSVAARAIFERGVEHIADVEAHENAEVVAVARARGYRAVSAVAMLRHDEPIGSIAVTRTRPGPFSEVVLQTFADQAVIAIENVRLFTELQARTRELARSVEELKALGEIGQAVSSSLDLETVLDTIVTRAVQLSNANGGVIYDYDDATQAFSRIRGAHGLDADLRTVLSATPLQLGEGAAGRAAARRTPVQVDARAGRRLLRRGPHPLYLRAAWLSLAAGCSSTPRAADRRRTRRVGARTGKFRTGNRRPAADAGDPIGPGHPERAAVQGDRREEPATRNRQQHKSEFLANMSHELRTPLNAIIGFSEVLTDRMFGELNEKQEEYLKDIYASGTHLLSLINDILDLSKIEAGRMELELTEFDLPTAIDNALMLVRERAGRRAIALQTNIDKQLGHIQADERKVRQVVLNLLSNAIKFTPETGRIDIGAVPKGGFVEVSVSDTGVGIAPEDQEAVFEEFRQVGTADKKVEGTGLGLTLCRKFVELHGGKICVKSEVGNGRRSRLRSRCGEGREPRQCCPGTSSIVRLDSRQLSPI